jgi:hypothetical protein
MDEFVMVAAEAAVELATSAQIAQVQRAIAARKLTLHVNRLRRLQCAACPAKTPPNGGWGGRGDAA